MELLVKNLPTNVGDIRNLCPILGGDLLEEGMAIHSSILA